MSTKERDKGSRQGQNRTSEASKANDNMWRTWVSESGSYRVESVDPKNSYFAQFHAPSGTNWAVHHTGEFNFTGAGEGRIEMGAMTVTARENIDIASGGHLSVKTVGGLEAQISGDGDITIAGGGNINILGNAGISIKGNASISTGGQASVTAAGGLNLRSGGDMTIGAAGGLNIQAGGGIKFQPKGAGKSGHLSSELAPATSSGSIDGSAE